MAGEGDAVAAALFQGAGWAATRSFYRSHVALSAFLASRRTDRTDFVRALLAVRNGRNGMSRRAGWRSEEVGEVGDQKKRRGEAKGVEVTACVAVTDGFTCYHRGALKGTLTHRQTYVHSDIHVYKHTTHIL